MVDAKVTASEQPSKHTSPGWRTQPQNLWEYSQAGWSKEDTYQNQLIWIYFFIFGSEAAIIQRPFHWMNLESVWGGDTQLTCEHGSHISPNLCLVQNISSNKDAILASKPSLRHSVWSSPAQRETSQLTHNTDAYSCSSPGPLWETLVFIIPVLYGYGKLMGF